MTKKRSWTDEQLQIAVQQAKSYRSVLIRLRLVPAGGNYDQIKRRITELSLSTDHFTGKGWNVGLQFVPKPAIPVELLLVDNIEVQSYKLKTKLFAKGLKKPICEMCGWHERARDGRIPLELDHINGNKRDNRIEKFTDTLPELS